MSGLAKQGHRFEPAEDFLDALPFSHTDLITGMARRAAIDGAAAGPLLILRDVGRYVHAPHFGHELLCVRIPCRPPA
jgi:hypothetical protein